LAGKSPLEEAIVDSLADQYADYRVEIKPWWRTVIGESEGDVVSLKRHDYLSFLLEQLKIDVVLPARDKFLGFITKFLKENKSGFLVGDSVTWVDVLISEHCATMVESFIPEFLDGYPEVKNHIEKVRAIPNLKKWIETRPKTKF
ncbi:unnamed protein product, partial [Strongylus vulgaris]